MVHPVDEHSPDARGRTEGRMAVHVYWLALTIPAFLLGLWLLVRVATGLIGLGALTVASLGGSIAIVALSQR